MLVLGAVLAAASSAGGADRPAGAGDAGPLRVVYFYSPTCLKCADAKAVVDEAEQLVVSLVEQRLSAAAAAEETEGGPVVVFVRWNIHEPAGLEAMFECEDRFGSEGTAPPKVYVVGPESAGSTASSPPSGDGGPDAQCLVGLEAIQAGLLSAIRDRLPAARPEASSTAAPTSSPDAAPGPSPDDTPDGAPGAATSGPAGLQAVSDDDPPAAQPRRSRIAERFGSFRVPAVAVAGLVDGLNPCAFATIVFLVSVLGTLGRTRRQVAIVGGAFTAAVFVTYLVLGVGMLAAFRSLVVSRRVSLWVNGVIAAGAFALAAWSVLDGVQAIRHGDRAKGTLRLPKRLSGAIHWVIRKGLRTRSLLVGAFAVGCLVSLLESLCTGQIYLPTIMLVVRTPGHRGAAMAYLVLYNLMFVLPLAAIMLLAYHGMKWQRLSGFLRRHLAAARFLMAGVFAVLGTMLVLVA